MNILTIYVGQGALAAVKHSGEVVIIDSFMPVSDEELTSGIKLQLDRFAKEKRVVGLALTGLDDDHACPHGMAAPHHGSKSGCNPRTVSLVFPNTVLISAGTGSQDGHPHSQALKVYRKVADHVFSTNSNGGQSLLTRIGKNGFETIPVTRKPIISQITSLRNLGIFRDYKRSKTRNPPEFRRYNLIYGFNGSGKTVISRVLSSLETGVLDPRLSVAGSFEVRLSDGETIRSSDSDSLERLKGSVAVFNVDFVEENIRWRNGTANPVFYIGKEQAELLEELEQKKSEIKYNVSKEEAARRHRKKLEDDFAKWKRKIAGEIEKKTDSPRSSYQAPQFTNDCDSYQHDEENILEEDKVESLESFVKQPAPLGKRLPLESEPVALAKLVADAKRVLETTVRDVKLEEIRVHETMIKWVSEGLDYHRREDLSKCLLCGNELSVERVEKLLEAIDEERFKKLAEDTRTLTGKAELAGKVFSLLRNAVPSRNDVSEEYRSRFVPAAKEFLQLCDAGVRIAETAEKLLKKKAETPNLPVESAELEAGTEKSGWGDKSFDEKLKTVNEIIQDHNDSHDRFEEEKQNSREKLKKHYLASLKEEYDAKKKESEEVAREHEECEETLKTSERERDYIEEKMRRHGPAADRINGLIRSYLGHGQLRLSTLEEGYQILRRDEPIEGPLSEGEKTAVALCYFLSTLEAERRKIDDLIVVVDDPVSSLDTKALNYSFNMLKAKLSGAAQVVVMTHNLDFMNEAKKWLKRKEEKDKASLMFLDVVQKNDGDDADTLCSSVVRMPRYLRDHESEYSYLFHLVLGFVNGHGEKYFYLMPNAIRKVLEIFLAFKRPKGKSLGEKIGLAIKESDENPDSIRIRALERLVQLESHSDNLDDLITHSSMTVEETRGAANALLGLMSDLDESHYDDMRELCGDEL